MALAFHYTAINGVGINADSREFIAASKSLLAGDGFLRTDGTPLAEQGPLFPSILATLGLADIDPVSAARWINGIVFGLIVFASGQLFRMHMRSGAIAVLGTASILVSWPIFKESTRVMTDPIFVLMAVLFVLYLPKFLTAKGTVALILVSVLAAVAWLERYSAITLIVTGLALIAFYRGPFSLRERVKYSAIFSLIVATPMAVWVTRNYMATSTFTGHRAPSDHSFFFNIDVTWSTVSHWFVPADTGFTMVPLMLLLFGALVGTLLVILRYRRSRRSATEVIHVWTMIAFVLVYSAYLISSATVVHANIGNRYLAPIFVFVMFFAFLGADELADRLRQSRTETSNLGRLYQLIGIGLVLLGLALNEWTIAALLPERTLVQTDRVWVLLIEVILVSSGLIFITLRSSFGSRRLKQLAVPMLVLIWLIYPMHLVFKATYS